MQETSISLIERLRGGPTGESWERFLEVYRPLIARWLRRYALQAADADDLSQQVLFAVIRKLRDFKHNQRPGAFRNWLRTITVNEVRAFWRAQHRRPIPSADSCLPMLLNELANPDSQLCEMWNLEHDRHVTKSLLEKLKPEFSHTTWLAFRRTVVDGRKPKEVSQDLHISVNAVLIAKSRVLRRLRKEAEGLLD